jgi:predicted SAM-dependent methyltransferase
LSDRWLAADVDPRSDIFVDITRPLPFPNASLDVVYSEETIEHVDEYQGQTMLRECFRILRPGGTLRITTPSFDYLSSQALQDVQKVRQLNAIFYEHGHRFIYTEHALLSALKDTGFSGILKSTYRDPKSKYGVFDSHPARFPHAAPEWSQYWEADKPPAVA